MSPVEVMMWRAEADPRLRSNLTLVEILDTTPDWDRFVAAAEWASRVVPRMRERVVEPPLGLGTPTWAVERELDLDYHLRRVRLPAPGSLRQLFDVAQPMAMAPFDKARPLWEAMLVEGLEGGRAGYVIKTHHSVTDGLGAVQLMAQLHSRTREPTPDKPQPPAPDIGLPSPRGLLASQVSRRLRSAPGDAVRLAGDAFALVGRTLAHPDRAAVELAAIARSLLRVAGPQAGSPSPLLAKRSLSWHFESCEVPLAELKAAGKAAGGSVNDAYIAAVLGAFRLYHEHFGAPIETLPTAIPISLRTGDDPMGGNKFAGARFAAPVGEHDPAERVRLVREFVLTARAEPAIDAIGMLAPALSLLPGPILAKISGGITATNDLQASNFPGIPYPVYLAGARITHMYPFGPLPGCAAMITQISHNGTCCIGANLDTAAITEPAVFGSYLRAGFDEVLALAGGSK